MKKNYILLISLFFYTSAIGQQSGVGFIPYFRMANRQIDRVIDKNALGGDRVIYERYLNVTPHFTYYKKYKQGRRIKEWQTFFNYSQRLEKDFQAIYNPNNTFSYEPYFAKVRGTGFGVNHLKFYRVGHFLDNKLNFWFGFRKSLSFYRHYSNTTTPGIGFPRSFTSLGIGLGIQSAATYQINPKWSINFNIIPNIIADFSYTFSRYQHPIIPKNQQGHGFITTGLQAIFLNPSFQLGVRYALKDTPEPESIAKKPQKPSNRYFGVGLDLEGNPSAFIPNFYKNSVIYGKDWSFLPTINAFSLTNYEKHFQELYIGKPLFIKNVDFLTSKNDVKDTVFWTKGKERYFSMAGGYSYFFKIQKLSRKVLNTYIGGNLEYYRFTHEGTPDNTELYHTFYRRTTGIKASLAATALWKLNKKMYLETRLLTGLSRGIEWEQNQTNSILYDADKNGKSLRSPTIGADLDLRLQVGLKYILKTEKPKKIPKPKTPKK